MPNSLRFLSEKKVASTISKLVCSAEDVRIAVAFWGQGGADLLGLSSLERKPRIICNLDSGACNPDELHTLRSRSKLRSHPQLHAKVYWTPSGVVIGSSNASTNGLWGERNEAKGWHEANLLVRHPAIIAEVGDWFDTQWDASYRVSKSLIEAARPIWDAGRRSRPRGTRIALSLTSAYRSDPTNPGWERVKVAVYDVSVSASAWTEFEAASAAEPVLADAHIFEGWGSSFAPGDMIIDVDAINRRRHAKVSMLSVGEKLIQSDTITYAWDVSYFDLPGLGRFKLNLAEQSAFRSIIPSADPPSFQWTPMLAFRSWRGVSDECSTPGVSGIVQAGGR